MIPLLHGTVEHFYQPNEFVGYELAGSVDSFNDGYKIVFNREPLGEETWHLFDIVNDLGKQSILKHKTPTSFSTR